MKRLPPLTNSAGAVLVISLLLTGVLLLLGTILLTMASTESQIAFNDRNGLEALYVAEAGAEKTRGSLFIGLLAEATTPADVVRGNLPRNAESRHSLPPDPLGIFSSLSDVLGFLSRLGGPVPFHTSHFTVRVTQNPESPERGRGTGYTLRITSSGESRGARRTIETTVSFDPLLLARSPAALVLLNNEVEILAEGESFRISGQDRTSGGLPESLSRPAIAVQTQTALEEVLNRLTLGQARNITGGDGGAPSVQVVTSLLTSDLLEYIEGLLASRANRTLTGREQRLTSDLGGTPQLLIATGETGEGRDTAGHLRLGGSFRATGVLIVNGVLTLEGSARFEGILVIIADGASLSMRDSSVISGTVLLATPNPQNRGGRARLSIAGRSEILYSREAILKAAYLLYPQLISWREVTFLD